MLGEKRTFLKESLGSIQDTGAIFPSSRWLARELTSPIYRSEKPLRILEVGAGTGPITCELVTQMRSKDSLTVVEINARMVETLKRRIAQLPNYEQQCDSIDIFVGPIQDLPETEKFDVIVCALPFNNFTADLCADILRKLQRLSHSETELTYFEYLGLRRLGRMVYSNQNKTRLKQVHAFFRDLHAQNGMKKERVWLNILPCTVYHLRLAHCAI